MTEAISRMKRDLTGLEDSENNSSEEQVMLHGTYLRDILLKSFKPEQRTTEEGVNEEAIRGYEDVAIDAKAESEPSLALGGLFKEDARILSWARRYSEVHPVVIEGDPVLEGLNSTQVRAVAMMVNNRMCLVQGVGVIVLAQRSYD
jgi:hypothetical protein